MMTSEEAKDLEPLIRGFDRSSLRPTETTERKVPVVLDSEAAELPSPTAPSVAAPAPPSTTPAATIADDAPDVAGVHGFKFADRPWAPAERVVSCDEEARPGYASMRAHEYQEVPETLRLKVAALAEMIMTSANTVAYAGAGLSTSANIPDYASKASGSRSASSRPTIRSPVEALPTPAHYVLSAMSRAPRPTGEGALLSYFIQQNHDGLPQKAGMHQSVLNEIHGAIFDPSNPVVPMSGILREDLFRAVVEWEEKADCVLALGTSLCGMNVDRVAVSAATRALADPTASAGLVIIGFQQTQCDASASLRIYAPLDEVMMALADELGIAADVDAAMGTVYKPPTTLSEVPDVFTIPYNPETGALEPGTATTLDLREGAGLKLTGGRYAGDEGVVLGKNREGHYRLQLRHCMNPIRSKRKVPFVRMLGSWFTELGVEGGIPVFPVVNVEVEEPAE